LLIALIASVIIPVRTAAWLGAAVVVALNGYLLWRGKSPRLNWVVAACADRVFLRLFLQRGWNRSATMWPEVLVLEASEIASMSIRTVEVYLDGSKPKLAQSLVIKPADAASEVIMNQVRSLLLSDDPRKQPYVRTEGGALTMKWRWCHPELPKFFQRLARECESIIIAPEERSELDLNGIWAGFSRNVSEELNAQERQQLVQAVRLGFGLECEWLLSRYQCIALQDSAAYLAEIVRAESGAESVAGCSRC
jgi:hypothetical protein